MVWDVAIVGLGKIARDQHLPALAGNRDLRVAAVASRNASLPDVPSYPALAELLAAEPNIPCVSLCTPPQVRYRDAMLAIDAGRNVMLEKPPGATLSEVHDLIERAERSGVTLFSTWHSRYAAGVEAARDWLSGRQIKRLKITWHEDVRHWHPGQDWVWEPGGLGVFDPGINALSILTKIMPVPLHLVRADLRFPENRDTPIAADLRFHEAGGALVEASFNWDVKGPPAWDISIETADGRARLNRGGAAFEADGSIAVSGADREYPRLYERFAELLRGAASEVDLAPMRHVADAFTLGKRISVAPFNW